MRWQVFYVFFVAALLFFPKAEQQESGIIPFFAVAGVAAILAIIFIPQLNIDDDGVTTVIDELSCPNPYQTYNGRCYAFFRDLKSRDDAQASCEMIEGDLISIETESESDMITELILGADDSRTETITTGAGYDPLQLSPEGITMIDRDYISFTAKACTDAHVILLEDQEIVEPYYVVSIGGFSNSRVTIYNGMPGSSTIQTYVETIPLKCDEDRPFWISYSEGTIKAGRGLKKGAGTVIEWTAPPTPLEIKYIAISSWVSNTVEWQFSTGRHYWTSGTRDPSDDYYTWETDVTAQFHYSNWKEGEPLRATQEHACVALDTKFDNEGKWGDEICDCRFSYICERGQV